MNTGNINVEYNVFTKKSFPSINNPSTNKTPLITKTEIAVSKLNKYFKIVEAPVEPPITIFNGSKKKLKAIATNKGYTLA